MIDARRIEELGLNSSAPPAQLLYDGWLLRLSPGKAKRARSVNAVYASTLPLERKIDHCERVYEAANLPMIFRITPFSQPAGLDDTLAERGYARLEPTAVEIAPLEDAPQPGGAREIELGAWIDAVGDLRGSSNLHRETHLARLERMPLAKRAVILEEEGRVVATGLTIVEDGFAGLFDIVTHTEARRRGHARRVVATLLAFGHAMGARHAYLQVESGNTPARLLYKQFGFAERYCYWYRVHPRDKA
ncbi:MAG: GNAT family N-acetyltransferase [Bacillota bacterium]